MSSQEQLTDANTSTHTIASQPFDDPDGDVVLRTTDNVHFISYKVLLSLASLFFKDMFTHANGADPSQETYDGRSCIAVQDESDGLYQLLSWCDPRGRPSKTLKDFGASLVLADKYGMIGVIKRIEDELMASEALIKEECVRVYAIARQFHFDNLAKVAARASLSVNMETFPPVEEFGQITGTAVYNLYTYYFQCRRAAQKVVNLSEWDTRSDATSFRKQVIALDMDTSTTTLPCCQVRSKRVRGGFVTAPTEWRTWWQEFMVGLGDKMLSQPVGSIMLDPFLKDVALRKMSSCDSCRHLTINFVGFLTTLPTEIEKAINKIPLKLD